MSKNERMKEICFLKLETHAVLLNMEKTFKIILAIVAAVVIALCAYTVMID